MTAASTTIRDFDDSQIRRRQRLMLAAAFLAWMFAGLENALFVLIHRQMMLELLGPGTAEKLVTQWFAWNQAAFMLGAAAGGWLFGWLGDRAGRTRAMGWSVVCYSSLTLTAWFVTDPQLMWTVRFLACLGFGGSWPNAVALVAEAWPSASRPLLAGLLGSAANFGFVLLGVIGLCFEITGTSWRWVLLVGASPLMIGLWILAVVPESSKWLAARKTLEERKSPNAAAASGIGPPSAARGSSIAEVFRPPLLYRTLLGIALGAIPVIGTAANANWVVPWTDQVAAQKQAAEQKAIGIQGQSDADSTAEASATSETGADGKSALRPAAPAPARSKQNSRQKAWTMITRSSGAILGSLIGGVIASVVGRRLTYFLISLCTFAVSSWLFTQLTPTHPQFGMFTFLLGFFGVTYFGWLPLFLPELFPTRVRSTGTGISFNSGRIIAAIVVIFVGLRMDAFQGDYATIGFRTGMIYALGMIIIWFAPRRDNKTLEDEA